MAGLPERNFPILSHLVLIWRQNARGCLICTRTLSKLREVLTT